MDKNSLLASLTGGDLAGDGGGGNQNGPDQDLFGDIDNDPPPLAVSPAPASAPPTVPAGAPPMGASLPPVTTAPASAVPASQGPAVSDSSSAPTPSLLSKSGLLGMANDSGGGGMFGAAEGSGGAGDGGGGLFDEVDQEEERKAAEARRLREEEERRKREEAEAARLKQQQEEEARRQQEEQLRQQQLQQQQQFANHGAVSNNPYSLQSPHSNTNGMQQNQIPQQQQQFQQQNNQQMPPSPYAPQQQQQQQQQQFPQQESAMMQSTMMAPSQQSASLNSQMQSVTLNPSQPQINTGFYREHSPAAPSAATATAPGAPTTPSYGGPATNTVSGSNNAAGNSYYYGTQQQQQQQQLPPGQVMHQQSSMLPGQPQMMPGQSQPNHMMPSTTAGMHNGHVGNFGQVRKITLTKPQDVDPLYTHIAVTEPMLIQSQNFLLSSPPYWSYQVTSTLANNQGTWLVRRRFRHVVALEDRLRQMCLGSILPPRPEKHATRALEEASTQQSAEFAMQRAKELEHYLNSLAKHPAAGQSQVLRLFLGLQDDIGTAWPEVSSNAFTRLGAVGAGVSMMVAESTNLTASNAPAHEWEENAELLTLCSSEHLRMGAVSQAVPKLEGTVTILRDQGDAAGALGLELSKVTKAVGNTDEMKVCDVLSNGMLRHGRRTKRLALELSAAMEAFLQQYKLVRYEKMAMQDRRHAIQRKAKERGKADARALYLSQQQRQLQASGQFNQLNQLERSAVYSDERALDVVSEADQIGARLKAEINRVAIERRTQWNSSMKQIARSMKEACSERRTIWEATLEAVQQLDGGGIVGGVAGVAGAGVAVAASASQASGSSTMLDTSTVMA